jgi:hypothetical protein
MNQVASLRHAAQLPREEQEFVQVSQILFKSLTPRELREDRLWRRHVDLMASLLQGALKPERIAQHAFLSIWLIIRHKKDSHGFTLA